MNSKNYAYRSALLERVLMNLVYDVEISKLFNYDLEKSLIFEKIIKDKLQTAEEMALEYEKPTKR